LCGRYERVEESIVPLDRVATAIVVLGHAGHNVQNLLQWRL
jgi:hypothetical protein